MTTDTTNNAIAAAINAVTAPMGLMPKAATRAKASRPIAPMIAPSASIVASLRPPPRSISAAMAEIDAPKTKRPGNPSASCPSSLVNRGAVSRSHRSLYEHPEDRVPRRRCSRRGATRPSPARFQCPRRTVSRRERFGLEQVAERGKADHKRSAAQCFERNDDYWRESAKNPARKRNASTRCWALA
jgi:hypothetical protein